MEHIQAPPTGPATFTRALDSTRVELARLAPAGPETTAQLAVWAFSYIRAIPKRELRYIALDGILAALEDAEAGQS